MTVARKAGRLQLDHAVVRMIVAEEAGTGWSRWDDINLKMGLGLRQYARATCLKLWLLG